MELQVVSGSRPSDYPRAGLVRLLCGVAGSGKTTYARQLERRGFVRLSVDDLIWRHFGRYGLDYAPPTLRARLAARARRFDADAAFPITLAQLDAFIAGFEAPDGEGEVVLRWDVPRGRRDE